MTSVGFPHSDISGSTPACDSPELFAANHVLHRLLTPRHPSCALSSLTTNLLWTELLLRRGSVRCVPRKLVDGVSHHNSRHAVYKVEIEAPRRSFDSTDSIDARYSQRHAFASPVHIRLSENLVPRGRCRLTAKNVEPAWVRGTSSEVAIGGA